MLITAKKGDLTNEISSSNLVSGTSKTAFKPIKSYFSTKQSFGVVNGVVSFEAFQEAKMSRKPYKSFTIVRCSPTKKYPQGEWYVEYQFEVPGEPFTYKPVKKRGTLNNIEDPAEREQAAQALLHDIKSWLSAGNMPAFALKKCLELNVSILDEEMDEAIEQEKPKFWTLKNAIGEYRAFLAKHHYSERTKSTYKCYVDNLEEWLKDAGLIETGACEFSEMDLEIILEEVYEMLGWSTRTYNNNFEFFGSFFNRCQKLEKIENHKLKRKGHRVQYEFDMEVVELKPTIPQVNKAYPPLIAQKIKKELDLPGNEMLRDYIEWITLTSMRPKEIRSLKIEHLDLESQHIRIVGKTGDRLVPLSTQTINLINKKRLMELEPSYYIFGRAMKPSAEKGGIDYPHEKYKPIKLKLGLDDSYKIYSWKPTGIIAMINAGFTDKEIMVQTGHKTQEAFAAYKRDLVTDNGHAMKGKTIDF